MTRVLKEKSLSSSKLSNYNIGNLANLASQLQLISVVIDSDFNIVDANDFFYTSLELNPQDSYNFRELIADEQLNAKELASLANLGQETVKILLPLTHRNHEPQFFDTVITKVENNNECYLVLGHQFITDPQSGLDNKTLSSVVKQTDDIVVVTDNQGNVEYVNPAFTKVTGYQGDEIIGKKLNVIKSGVHDEDYYKRMWQKLNNGETFQATFTNKTKFGTTIYIDELITPITNSKSEITNFVATGRDVTSKVALEQAIQESEAKFRRLAEFSPAAILIHKDGKIVYTNKAAQDIFGYSQEEVIGMSFLDYVHPDQREMINKIRDDRLHGKEVPTRYEAKLLDKKGETRWLDLLVSIIDYEGGQAVLGLGIDISEQRTAEQQGLQLKLEQELRLKLAEAITGYLDEISHDFKTPISIMNTNIYLLEQQVHSEYERSQLEQLKQQTTRLAKLTKNIMEYSKLIDKRELRLEKLNLYEFIVSVKGEMAQLLKMEKVDFYIETNNPGLELHIDQQELSRVFYNLIENSINYSPQQKYIKIEIFDDDNMATIIFTDRGQGIHPEDMENIFNPFYRGKDVSKQKHKSNGLGLAIVKEIVELHKGTITVQSAIGEGTTFRIKLLKY